MGTYAVALTKCETATYTVEADDPVDAESIATQDAEENWEADTVNLQVDDVSEVVSP